MAEEQREVARYIFDADITALESKARRASELATGTDQAGQKIGRFAVPQIADQARAAAQQQQDDQAAFETWRARAKEEEEQTRRTSTATEELIAHKRGLTAVIYTLGGSFGGLAAHLISITSLMLNVGKAVAGWIAAAAGITLLVNGIKAYYEATRQAAEQQERLNAATAAQQKAKLGPAQQIAETLQQQGMIGRQREAEQLYGAVGKRFGMPLPELSGLAAAAGVTSPEDVAVVREAMLRAQGQGQPIEMRNAEDFRRVLQQTRQGGAYQPLLEQARGYRLTAAGQAGAAPFLEPGGAGPVGPGPEQIIFDRMSEAERKSLGVNSVEDLRTMMERGQAFAGEQVARRTIQQLREVPFQGAVVAAQQRVLERNAAGRRYAELARQIERPEAGVGGAPAGISLPPPDWVPAYERMMHQAFGWQPMSAEGRIQQTIINIGEAHHYGTVYQDPTRRAKRHSFDLSFGNNGATDPRSPM